MTPSYIVGTLLSKSSQKLENNSLWIWKLWNIKRKTVENLKNINSKVWLKFFRIINKMGIYRDIKKLDKSPSKLLFAILKIYERGFFDYQTKLMLKSEPSLTLSFGFDSRFQNIWSDIPLHLIRREGRGIFRKRAAQDSQGAHYKVTKCWRRKIPHVLTEEIV